MKGVRCELWTHTACLPWIPEGYFEDVRTDFGESNLSAFTARYKAGASQGDSDADGQRYLLENGMANFIAIIGDVGPFVPESEGEPLDPTAAVSRKGAEAFRQRLSQSDVIFVIFEALWGKWARAFCLELGKKCHGLMPSYISPFRAAYCTEPVYGMDGQCIIRNRLEDLDGFHGCPAEDISYIIADCLVGKATECGSRRRFGAFLPVDGTTLDDKDLQKWLDGADLPEETRTVTLVALGSQSALSSLSASAETDLLRGALEASPRVLVASQGEWDDAGLSDAVMLGKLRSMVFVPQWAVLNHPNVRCFVSHGGANSVHEALAAGKAIVPLPFFDDQFYIASRLEELFCYTATAAATREANYAPLRKAALRAGGDTVRAQVSAAVRLGLAVPMSILKPLQESVVKEDGATEAAEMFVSQMGF